VIIRDKTKLESAITLAMILFLVAVRPVHAKIQINDVTECLAKKLATNDEFCDPSIIPVGLNPKVQNTLITKQAYDSFLGPADLLAKQYFNEFRGQLLADLDRASVANFGKTLPDGIVKSCRWPDGNEANVIHERSRVIKQRSSKQHQAAKRNYEKSRTLESTLATAKLANQIISKLTVLSVSNDEEHSEKELQELNTAMSLVPALSAGLPPEKTLLEAFKNFQRWHQRR